MTNSIHHRISGNKDNPTFELEGGQVIELVPVKVLVISRWDSEYRKKNPPPAPPVIILENGDPYPNVNDPSYQHLLGQWEAAYNRANMEFLLKVGIKTNPPDEWEYPFPELVNGSSPHARVLWLETILSGKDLEVLPRLIMGLENVTEEGLGDAEKN